MFTATVHLAKNGTLRELTDPLCPRPSPMNWPLPRMCVCRPVMGHHGTTRGQCARVEATGASAVQGHTDMPAVVALCDSGGPRHPASWRRKGLCLGCWCGCAALPCPPLLLLPLSLSLSCFLPVPPSRPAPSRLQLLLHGPACGVDPTLPAVLSSLLICG